MMMRGFVSKIASRGLFSRQARLFSAENAPALGKGKAQAQESGVMRYVNGELIKRNELTLKKSEDIEG